VPPARSASLLKSVRLPLFSLLINAFMGSASSGPTSALNISRIRIFHSSPRTKSSRVKMAEAVEKSTAESYKFGWVRRESIREESRPNAFTVLTNDCEMLVSASESISVSDASTSGASVYMSGLVLVVLESLDVDSWSDWELISAAGRQHDGSGRQEGKRGLLGGFFA
jgi:hypothetical protein